MADKKPEKKQECVQVVVRCRPFNTKEKKENRGEIIQMETALFQISITNPAKRGNPPKNFTFDAVYDETTQQKAFYEESCYDLVEGVMEGYNGTIFAYGQTGCGKTHTMQGYNDPPELRGVIPHSFDHIFENIKGSVNTAFLVRCCYLEIYNEEVRDLLAGGGDKREKLELKEEPNKGVYVKGLTQAVVSNQEGINRLMDQGQKMRTVGATAMNETSSRSHSIFTIVVEMNDVDEAGKDHIRVGKLNLVDLAGSERASKTGASGDRLKEGCKINLSLSALGNVISALVDGNGKHIPYRDSKLTRLLQDSLGGNTKTLMVAAISPADYNYEETLSTLRYANRAKNIKNKPKINEDPKDAMLRQYKEEIEALKQQLAASLGAMDSSGNASRQMTPAPPSGAATTGEVVPPPVDPESHASRQSVQDQSTVPAAVPTAGASSSAVEDQGRQGQGAGDEAKDSAKSDTGESEAAPSAAAGADQEDEAHQDAHGIAGGGSMVDVEGETVVGRGVEHTVRNAGKANDDREPGGKVEETQPASSPQVPEVVVQEKIVERVVVEEKVVVQEVEVEVESQKMAEHRQALENYSRAVEEQRNRLGQELETSVIRADVEKRAREELERKLDALQTKVIGLSSSSQDRRRVKRFVAARGSDPPNGGESSRDKGCSVSGPKYPACPSEVATEDPEVIIARRNAEHRRMQAREQRGLHLKAKLRQKRRKETRLELERVRALEEKAEVEKEMADMVGQAEEKERRLNKSRKKLERKLMEARGEIEDLTMEHEAEREELLDSIRNQNKELQLWEQVARQMLTSKEIARIWERGEYNEDDQTWVLPRIKPRSSFSVDPCKLPLLGTITGSGSGIEEDGNNQASRGNSARKDKRRGGGRSSGADARTSVSGGPEEVSGRNGNRSSLPGNDSGSGKRRRSVAGGRGGSEDRPPRRLGEEMAPKEGGGGMFDDVDKPWDAFAGREVGARNKASSNQAPAHLWDNGLCPADDHYRGLTPPISPSQGPSSPNQGQQSRPRPSRSRGSFVDASDGNSRHPNRPDSGSSTSVAGWGFSGEGSRREEVELPPQDGGDGVGSRADRCPSRQGGTRAGSRGTSGSRLGREHRRQQQQGFPPACQQGADDRPIVPETFLLRQNAETAGSISGGGDDQVFPSDAGEDGARTTSRRGKTRPMTGGGEGRAGRGGSPEKCEEHMDWGTGSAEQHIARNSGDISGSGGGGRKDRRPKSKARRGERVDQSAGGRSDEGGATSYPSLLDSTLWKDGRDMDAEGARAAAGGSRESGADLYEFRG